MKVWITQYALSSGVLIIDAEVCDDEGDMIKSSIYRYATYHKPHWHETETAAFDRVRQMIAAKRKSLEKSLKQLAVIEQKIEAGQLPMSAET